MFAFTLTYSTEPHTKNITFKIVAVKLYKEPLKYACNNVYTKEKNNLLSGEKPYREGEHGHP
jgi:hypothetical protein